MPMCIAVGDYGDRRPASSSDIDAVKNFIISSINYLLHTLSFCCINISVTYIGLSNDKMIGTLTVIGS